MTGQARDEGEELDAFPSVSGASMHEEDYVSKPWANALEMRRSVYCLHR